MDFGVHDAPFIDPKRVKYLRKTYKQHFELEGDWTSLKAALRPQSVDDLPILGPLSKYPNVLMNAGHGGHGLSISFACAQIISDIVEGKKSELLTE